MKRTTLDLISLKKIANYFSEFEPSVITFMILRIGDLFNVFFANENCQKEFGYFHEDTQLAESYLPNDIWLALKPMLIQPHDEMKINFDSNHKISILVGKDGHDTFYLCTIHKKHQDSSFISLLEQNLDSIVTIDEDGTILNSNQAAKAKFGYKESYITGKSLYEFVSIFSKDKIQKLIKETVSLKKPLELADCGIKTIEGKTVVIFAKSIPIIENQNVIKILLLFRDITPYNDKNISVTYLSYHDQLTGAWNNKALNEHFPDVIQEAKRQKQKVAVLSIDLDRFKKVNENYGSSVGDIILSEATKRISYIINDSSYLYKLNGDHFIFVVQNTTKEQIQSIAIQIIDLLKEPINIGDLELSISASIGIACFPNDGDCVEELLRKSNQALFYVKERGRSGYRFYQNEMEDQFRNTALMEAHLRRAIEKEELIVYYQPQIDLETEKITSFEALLRWQNPKFGFVSPDKFIPIAEDSGLIIEIGDWVLEQACKQLGEWKKQNITNVRIAVNISPKQFREDKLASKILQYLNRYDVKPEMLELEITESSMTDAEDTMIILKQLKSMGLIISIDDFGTGYSSLSYIKRYPIDIIKIDQSFIRDMDTDEKDRAIAKTIIHLAHSLGLDVIAEGVEKEEHVGFLKDHQCKKAQGFLFSKPLPLCELMKTIPLMN
ncbi:EAL domain-containing protein [Rummeliibacillus sp. NPDC094406]|uniref:EAL domain-containing protein n=1 Tax=Rummeliibacillus sp. NPDC094406 TaxID=3364511 RepID=UPI003813BC7D